MTSLINQKNFISELLPYNTSEKTKGSLKTGLKEYQLLLTATSEAMIALQQGHLEKFDAVVGENACQIRAAKIAMMFPTYLSNLQAIQEKIENANQKLGIVSGSLHAHMKNGVSLQTILEGIDVALTPDELFIVQSFLLSAAKIVLPSLDSSPLCRNDVAKPQELKKFGKDVSGQFTERLVRSTRQLLSAASVDFVRSQARFLEDRQLEDMCSEDFTVRYNSWPCLPMFWTYKTLLLSLEKAGVPLVIHAKFRDKNANEECLFFKSDCNERVHSYEEVIPYPEDLTKSAVVVQGIVYAEPLPSKSAWKSAMATKKLDVILAGAADHRQYPDEKEDERIEALGNEEFEGYRTKAKNDGCALSNPSLFFIQHVYASLAGNLPQIAEKARWGEQYLRFLPGWPQRVLTPLISYLEDDL